MASFRIPCNWDMALLDALDGVEVSGIYGMLPSHAAGGGRPTAALPAVDEAAAAEFIGEAKARGLAFNYLFNAPCMDAMEFTEPWRAQFLAHLDWAVEAGIASVTVAVPYLMEVIRKRHPGLGICVSSYARVNGVRRAKYYEELGADEITLDPVTVTRDFSVLEAMAGAVKCRLALIANGLCLYQCPYAQYHMVLMGHSSQSGHPSGGYYEEYPFYNCTLRKLADPAELIRAGFIRPEDLGAYEEIGISTFKLVDRSRPTEWLAKAIGAYASGSWDGDLLEVVNFPHFFLGMLYGRAGGEGEPVFPRIENRRLDGFLDRLRAADCGSSDCASCTVCADYAEKAVEVPGGVERLAAVLQGALARLNFG